jgi:UDP-3-O-[3-hydroxymyristoyl] glucosamine N-acyltransferase
MRTIKISELFKNNKIIGPDVFIDSLCLLNRQTSYCSVLGYVEDENYLEKIDTNTFKVLIVRQSLFDLYFERYRFELTYVIDENPEILFYQIHEYLFLQTNFYRNNFKSIIEDDTQIDKTVIIEDGVIIGKNVKIGFHSIIRSGTIIEDNVYIGNGVIIGSEGFQVVGKNINRKNIIHTGGTMIKSNSYIGDNSMICKSLFEGYTVIGSNTKIDNLVQVAHNCIIGDNVVLASGVNLCGSVNIHDNVWIGTNSTVLNKVIIESDSIIGIGSVVTKNIKSNSVAYGVPAIERRKNTT